MTEPAQPLPARPTVVVVGGGYAGINVAKGLDGDADVVLVDPKEAFAHNVAALRVLADPTWLPRAFYPLDRLLEHGRFVRDRVVHAESGRVVLGSGEELHPDVLVLASGSTYPFPAKTDATELRDTYARYEQAHESLAGAARVLLLGAGPVGLELAGEISSAWPDKHVTIVDVASDIVAGPYKPEFRSELRRQLDERGVELVLGDGLQAEPPTAPGEPGTVRVRTASGREIEADLWYRCYGVRPVTDYLAGDLAAARSADGFVRTRPTLQVEGHERVFALGDASSIDIKMAGRAKYQADAVVANVQALIAGRAADTEYVPLPPVMLIPLGPDGGAAQLPGQDEIGGPEAASTIKGAHMLVDSYAALFGLTEADLTRLGA
jgi:NADH dehydrogenase FAD-containing subunit